MWSPEPEIPHHLAERRENHTNNDHEMLHEELSALELRSEQMISGWEESQH